MRIEASGTVYSVTEAGDASRPAMVLIHGWCCDASDWDPFIELFAQDFHLVVPELAGHGRSGTRPDGYTPIALADDLAEVLRQLDVSSAVLVGHSLGAVVASCLSVRHSDLSAALILIDPAYGRPEGHSEQVRAWIGDPRSDDAQERALAFVGSEAGSSARVAERNARRCRIAAGMDPYVIWRVLADLHLSADQVSTRPASSRYLVMRRTPALSIHADGERAAWERALETHPRSVTQHWPGSGHWPHQDEPGRFVREASNWLHGLREVPSYTRPQAARSAVGTGAVSAGAVVTLEVSRLGERPSSTEELEAALLEELAAWRLVAAVPLVGPAPAVTGGIHDVRMRHNQLAGLVRGLPDRFPVALVSVDERVGLNAMSDETDRCLGELAFDGIHLSSSLAQDLNTPLSNTVLQAADKVGGFALLDLNGPVAALVNTVRRFPDVHFGVSLDAIDDAYAVKALADMGVAFGVGLHHLIGDRPMAALHEQVSPSQLFVDTRRSTMDTLTALPLHAQSGANLLSQLTPISKLVRRGGD